MKEEWFYFIIVIWWLIMKGSFLWWGISNVGSCCVMNCDVIFGESMSSLWVNGRKIDMFFFNLHCLHSEGSHWLVDMN